MTLHHRLQQDLREGMRAGDTLRVSTLRLALAAVHNAEIDKRGPLSDEEVQEILRREVKRRREAIEAYRRGGREDRAEREGLEMALLLQYLPPQLSEDALRTIVAQAIAEVDARSPRDVGRVMSVVLARVKAQAEGATVNRLVREALSQAAGRAGGAS